MLLPVMARFRARRVAFLRSTYPDIDGYKVLDLGGSTHFWEVAAKAIRPREITLLNIADDEQSGAGPVISGLSIQLYDGKTIPYPDTYFDLVICNSVIEHVPPPARPGLACEIMRVGKRVFVQTPAYEFPLEPHFLAPLIHWLPRRAGRKLAPFTPYGFIAGSDPGRALRYFDEVRLLRRAELSALFQGTRYRAEKFLGLTKSHMVVS